MPQAIHKTYDEMKDSHVEWIGEMPKAWNIVRFKQMHRGANVGLSLDKNYWSTNEDDTVFYTAGLKPIHTSCRDIEPEMLTKVNDLLLARNGTPYVYFPCVGAIYTDHIIRVGIENGYNKPFVRYCLQQSIDNEVVDTVSIATWSVPIWNRQRLPHPSLPEQTVIADYLDEKCAAIDAIIAEAKATIDEYKAWKASVIFEAVTKGLNPNAEMKDSGVEWIGAIPKHWDTSRIKNECINMDSLREPISAENRINTNRLYDYYGASGIIDKIDGYNVDDTVLLIGEDGANLVFRNLPLVYRASGKFWVNNHAHILKVKEKNDYGFMAYMLEAGDYTNFITGSAQPKLTQSNLMRFPILAPPLPEQTAIADYLDEKCAAIDAIIAEKEALIGELETYKKSLIYECVTGKREVS